MQGFDKSAITHGGIGLDNAGKVPRQFLDILKRQLNASGLGIAANGCPEQYLSYIDFFGNEGFPFTIDRARHLQSKGLRGILGEFTTQHLSGGELDAYLKSKLFNGIVFFGFTNGGVGAGAMYSVYASRPDVYHHQRWVLRQVIPVSRAVQRAGRQPDPGAKLAANTSAGNKIRGTSNGAFVDADGKVVEAKRGEAGLDTITGRLPGTSPSIIRFGHDVAKSLFLFVDSGRPEEVICDGPKLGVRADTLVFDEFTGRVLDARRGAGSLIFKTSAGPSVVQLGSAMTLSKSLLERVAESLRSQLTQRALDRELKIHYPRKAWSRFCQAGKWDSTVANTGKGSLAVTGGTYTGSTPQWKYTNRQGAAQFVTLNQKTPAPVIASAFSKSSEVISSDKIVLDTTTSRRRHFDARDGHTYCMHLYLDYQDGHWPEVHSVPFSAGTHDWEQKSIHVEPTRPVKSAMVLLEFHQPQGAAWFDDVSLSNGIGDEQNLLAVGGFEDDDEPSNVAWAISTHYEEQLRLLLNSIETTAESTTPGDSIEKLEQQVDTLVKLVLDKNLAPYFPREFRDLDEAKTKLGLCTQLLKARE
jgi:hypothetical protein